MKFFAGLFALMAVTSVAAAPYPQRNGGPGAQVAKSPAAAKGGLAGALAGVAASKAAKGNKGDANAGNANANANAGNANANAANANANAANANANAGNANANAGNANANAGNANANAGNANAGNATATATASGATRTRACDMGDQSLAAGLQASVTIGIGQQAAVVTLQNATAAADFTDGQTRLQQFVDTQALQLQMIQGIADDGSLAQPQIALLATAATSQAALVKGLVDAKTSAADLTTLLDSFTTSTGDAQDGVNNALIDCFIPLTAVSG
jgi:hypothetical protein